MLTNVGLEACRLNFLISFHLFELKYRSGSTIYIYKHIDNQKRVLVNYSLTLIV